MHLILVFFIFIQQNIINKSIMSCMLYICCITIIFILLLHFLIVVE